jgi:hypothetical protein
MARVNLVRDLFKVASPAFLCPLRDSASSGGKTQPSYATAGQCEWIRPSGVG